MSTASIWEVTATNAGGGGGELPPAGNHPGVLVGLIDLGSHDEEYQGKKYVARKVLLAWELTAEHKSDGSPFVVIRDFNLMNEMGKKNGLRILLESWRGAPMDEGHKLSLNQLLGKPCLVNVTHEKTGSGKEVYKVKTVTPVPKTMTVPRALCEPMIWDTSALPFRAPDWLPFLYGRAVDETIAESYEARGLTPPAQAKEPPPPSANGTAAEASTDDVPF
jgi:hypothetical protein